MQSSSDRATHKALKKITVQNQIESPLLRLPAEIRNQVYKYVLTRDEPIKICINEHCSLLTNVWFSQYGGEYTRYPSHAHAPRHLLHILEVCKQTHAEAKLLVFGLNKFTGLLAHVDGYVLRGRLSWQQQDALTSLDVDIVIDDLCDGSELVSNMLSFGNKWQLEDIASLQGLEELVVNFTYSESSTQTIAELASWIKAIVKNIIDQMGKTLKVQVVAQFVNEW